MHSGIVCIDGGEDGFVVGGEDGFVEAASSLPESLPHPARASASKGSASSRFTVDDRTFRSRRRTTSARSSASISTTFARPR